MSRATVPKRRREKGKVEEAKKRNKKRVQGTRRWGYEVKGKAALKRVAGVGGEKNKGGNSRRKKERRKEKRTKDGEKGGKERG